MWGAEMIVYHGSAIVVSRPDVYHSRDNVDFGKGFYVTPIKEQASKWAARFKRHQGNGIISVYEFQIEECRKHSKVLEFTGYTEEWLDVITSCRRKENTDDYDMIIGGVANDKVFNTIELYFDGLIEKKEAIKRLRYEKPNLQMCFRTQTLIEKYLTFIESEEI